MLNTRKFAALSLLSALASNIAFAEDNAAVMVNGVAVPQVRIDSRVKAALAQGQQDTPELRKAVREDVINLEVLAQEAVRLGLDKDADVAQQIEIARESILAGAFVQNNMKDHTITEEQLKQEYDKIKVTAGGKEYNVRHILVESDVDARAIIAKLGKKGNFNKIAAEKSMDTGSADQGGALGWAVPSSFDPSFAEGLVSLKKGEYSKTPVESQYGWHIIKLDDVRDLKIPPFEEFKPQIAQSLQQKAIADTVTALRAKAKID